MNLTNASKKDSKEEGSESIEQEPQKQLKRGKCSWLDAERDIGSVGVKVSGLKQCLHVGKCFPFIQKVRYLSRHNWMPTEQSHQEHRDS